MVRPPGYDNVWIDQGLQSLYPEFINVLLISFTVNTTQTLFSLLYLCTQTVNVITIRTLVKIFSPDTVETSTAQLLLIL